MTPNDASAREPVVLPGPAIDAETAFSRLAHASGRLWLDSARPDERLGRYSFLTADPIATFSASVGDAEALNRFRAIQSKAASRRIADLPPFQGGWAGLLSYDLGHALERFPRARFDEFSLPAMHMSLYDVVLAIDHKTNQSWIISHGWDADGTPDRDRAARRADVFLERLKGDVSSNHEAPKTTLPIEKLAPQFATNKLPGLTSTFAPEEYIKAVERAIEYVHAGDLFQVNLSQRLLTRQQISADELYLRLRRRNAAPFACYYEFGETQILSASPERFLCVNDRVVETRPIKGTRTRTGWPEADLYRADELRTNPKDRAENVMIVDLLRNDLSRVCQPDSVRVESLCRLETYAYVQHLVSEVRGRLRADASLVDLIAASFPGGSITGAPKPRALEVISELEPTARGAYCGSLGYFTPDGWLDTNILIRTMTLQNGWIQMSVGGGIVADSRPADEYQETWHKAEGMLRALV